MAVMEHPAGEVAMTKSTGLLVPNHVDAIAGLSRSLEKNGELHTFDPMEAFDAVNECSLHDCLPTDKFKCTCFGGAPENDRIILERFAPAPTPAPATSPSLMDVFSTKEREAKKILASIEHLLEPAPAQEKSCVALAEDLRVLERELEEQICIRANRLMNAIISTGSATAEQMQELRRLHQAQRELLTAA